MSRTNHRAGSLLLWLITAILIAASPTTAHAQAEGDTTETSAEVSTVDARLSSPEDAVFTFLAAMERYRESGGAENISEALVACDLSGVELESSRRELAGTLYNILNRIGRIQRWQFPEEVAGDRYTLFPDERVLQHASIERRVPGFTVALVRDESGAWRFSSQTMHEAEERWREWEPLPLRVGEADVSATLGARIQRHMPEELRGRLLALEYWQWLAILAAVLLGVTLDHVVRGVLSRIWRRLARRVGRPATKDTLKRAVRPFGMLAAGVLWYALLTLGGLPEIATSVLVVAVKVILSFAGVWAAWRLTDLLAEFFASKAAATDTKIDDLLVPLLERTLKVFIVAIGLVYIAEAFHIPVLPLLSGLGIGGLAIAFAAKDTIENFFGSIAVIMDRPFEVGDWIVTGDVEGTVETMGFRSTRIRTFYNSLVTVPNASLVRATVDNYGRRRYRRYKTNVGLTYSTPADKIEAFCEGVREIIRAHPYTRKDYYHVWLNGWGPSSLDVLVYMFFETPDWSVELRERHRFILDVVRLADRLGIDFAFPTRTVEFTNSDLRPPSQPTPVPKRNSEIESIREGMDTAREVTANQPWREVRPGRVAFGSSPAAADAGELSSSEGE